jgi:hypothetical protein
MGKPKPRAKKRRSQARQDQLVGAQRAYILRQKQKSTSTESSKHPVTRSNHKSYVSTLETRVLSAENTVNTLELKMAQERSTNKMLRRDLETASCNVKKQEKYMHHLTRELEDTQAKLGTVAETLDTHVTLTRKQKKAIQRYQTKTNADKKCIRELQDQISWQLLRSEAISRESVTKVARLLTKLQNVNAQVTTQRQQLTHLQRIKKRWQMKSTRAKSSLGNVRNAYQDIKTFSMTDHGLYTPQARSLARILSHAGCSEAKVGSVLHDVANELGVRVTRKMSRPTVQRCKIEGAVASKVQLGYELAKAEGKELEGLFSPILVMQATLHRIHNEQRRHITSEHHVRSTPHHSPCSFLCFEARPPAHSLPFRLATRRAGPHSVVPQSVWAKNLLLMREGEEFVYALRPLVLRWLLLAFGRLSPLGGPSNLPGLR